MKCIIYSLIVSLLFSCNISFSKDYPAIRNFITNALVFCVVVEVAWKITPYVWEKCKNIFSYLSTSFMNEKNTKKSESININALTHEKLVELTKQRNEREAEEIKKGTELHKACDANDVKKVALLLLKNEIDINALRNTIEIDRCYDTQYIQGGTALHIACKNKNQNIIDLLLAHPDIDVSLEDNRGYTSLYFAVLYNDQDLIDRLLDHETMKFIGCRVLCKACEKGYVDIVSKLVARNVDDCMHINEDKWWNPLLATCEKIGRCENKIIVLVRMRETLLRKENIDIYNMRNKYGDFPMKYQMECQLSKEKNPQNIQKMIEKIQGRRDKLINVIKVLLEHQYISFNVITDAKKTVFHLVVSNAELLKLLWEKNQSLPKEKQSCFDAQAEESLSALHYAAEVGNKESFFFLLEHEAADLVIKKHCLLTRLCKDAAEEMRKNPEETRYKDIILRLFNDHKIVTAEALNVSDSLLATVGGAVADDYLPQLLLEKGADPNKKNRYGISPILQAAMKKNLPLLNLFIDQHKGDIEQKNNKNHTIFYIAFMEETVNSPNEINYFTGLEESEQKEFMQQELTMMVDNGLLDNIFTYSLGDCREEWINENINRFKRFTDTCMNYVSDKKAVVTDLLAKARTKAQERQSNFVTNKNQCMYSADKVCYGHQYECHYCKNAFQCNEVIIHALIRHTDINDVDQQIAEIYDKTPAQYYSLSQQEKEKHKITLQKLLDSGQLCKA